MKKSIQLFSLIVIFLMAFLACDDADVEQVCGTDTPLEDVKWLNDLKTEFVSSQEKDRITQYDYNNEVVFLVENCYDCSDALAVVYNCEEETLCQFGGIAGFDTCPDFDSTATNAMILYED